MTHTTPLRQPHFFILALFAFSPVFRLVLKDCHSGYRIWRGMAIRAGIRAGSLFLH